MEGALKFLDKEKAVYIYENNVLITPYGNDFLRHYRFTFYH